MVLLESIVVPLGAAMPSFSLADLDGNEVATDSVMGDKGLLVVFTCNHCPYAQAVWERVINVAEKAKALGINTIAINPNIHPEYPEDSPAAMKKLINTLHISFPYVADEDQSVAKSFKAQCTPDLYVLNNKKELVYHGRIDDNWQDPDAVTSHELLAAINALANGLEISKDQKPSLGCSIKWK